MVGLLLTLVLAASGGEAPEPTPTPAATPTRVPASTPPPAYGTYGNRLPWQIEVGKRAPTPTPTAVLDPLSSLASRVKLRGSVTISDRPDAAQAPPGGSYGSAMVAWLEDFVAACGEVAPLANQVEAERWQVSDRQWSMAWDALTTRFEGLHGRLRGLEPVQSFRSYHDDMLAVADYYARAMRQARVAAERHDQDMGQTAARLLDAGNERFKATQVPQGLKGGKKPATSTAQPAPFDGDERIRRHCEEEWPSNFQMQAYCVERQQAAARELEAETPEGVVLDEMETIRAHCLSQWPSDYVMQSYCEKKQVEALRELRGTQP